MQDPIYAKIESTPRPTLFAASGFVLLAAVGLWVSSLAELLLSDANMAVVNALYSIRSSHPQILYMFWYCCC